MADANDMPKYTGMQKFTDVEGGYFLWIPAGWKHRKMDDQGNNYVFYPFEDRMDTIFASERRLLDYKVNQEDLPVLKEGFIDGIKLLPGVEVEMVKETITEQMMGIEVKFSYLDGGQTRVRWMRLIYSGSSLLVLTAQGATPEEFQRFSPMFFNIMMSTTFV